MRVLAIETATPVASAALVDASGVSAEMLLRAPRRHLEWLLPAVREMLGYLGLGAEAVEGLAVSVGPGGFTGLRIGIATAAAWAKAAALPVLGVGTLDALARVPGVEGLVLPVLDAHRGEVAAALYALGPDGAAECLRPPVVARPEILAAQVRAEVAARPGPVLLLGDGVERYGPALASLLGPRARLGGPHLHPRAAAVGLLARPGLLRGERTEPHELLPLYGRRPVAWPAQGPAGEEASSPVENTE